MAKKKQKKTRKAKKARRKKETRYLRTRARGTLNRPMAKRSTKTLARKKKARRKRIHVLGRGQAITIAPFETKGLGARSAGQSGDTQGLSGIADVNSESVEELLEEGQSFEAEVVSGVENAADPDEEEVITHEVLADDVPEEYLNEK